MGIVCRPILLHNEFLPARTGTRNWEYQMFGHYDGMSYEKSFCLDETCSFERLFEVCAEYDSAIRPYFTQILFGFHPEKKKEEEFWKKDAPFFYLTLLQFSDKDVKQYREYLESSSYLEMEYAILELCGIPADTVTIAYHSFDNSDLLFLIKCKSARTGAELINNLHQNKGGKHPFRLKNSYSILGAKKTDIDKPGPFLKEDETIDMLELRIVERKSNSIGSLYNLLKQKLEIQSPGAVLERKALLGTEDEAIIIKNLSWNVLAPFYREKEGILCNSNDCTKNYANAISTKIMIPTKGLSENCEIKEAEPKKLLCDVIYDKINKIYKNRKDEQGCAEKKNLLLLLNALCRFEYSYRTESVFSDYNFFSMLLPLHMFTELMAEQKGNTSEYYYDFMKSMKLRTQNFAKPDRVYSQITDFNMRYFDVPAKFVTVYSAYVYYMKNALNVDIPQNEREDELQNDIQSAETRKNYEFLVCPGVSSKVRVGELFRRWSSMNRLFLIEIPERQVYNLKLMFIILGHEIAHFVGTDVRQRPERLNCVLKISNRVVLLSMKSYLSAGERFHMRTAENRQWENIEEKLTGWIKFYVNRCLDMDFLRNYYYKESVGDEVVEKNLEFNNFYYQHTDVLEHILITAIGDMLIDRGADIFSFVIREEFEKEVDRIGYDNRENYYREKREILQGCIYDFVEGHGQQDKSLTVTNAMNEMIYLLKECYADIICILTLHLSLRDYMYAFVMPVEASEKDISVLRDTIVIARVAIVMAVMSYPLEQKKDGGFQWTNREFEYMKEEDEKIIELERTASAFEYNYIVRKSEISPEKMIDSAVQIVYDQEILKEIIRYLLRCRIKFSDANAVEKEDMKKVRQFYKLAGENDADTFFREMMLMLHDYESEIYKDIDKLVEEEKND